MSKKLTSIYVSLVVFVICIVSRASTVKAITIWTPKAGNSDNDVPQNIARTTWKYSIMDIISTVNSYLWFGIGFFCFLFMIVNWYKLITAQWDEKKMESATKGLIWSAIGITVCLLAYIIVNLATKLF